MPRWTPDGRAVRFVRGGADGGTVQLWVVDAATGTGEKLAAHADGVLDGVRGWFPDGRRLAFQSNRSGATQIWVVDIDGAHPRQVTGQAP